jgi:hypothetical protein
MGHKAPAVSPQKVGTDWGAGPSCVRTSMFAWLVALLSVKALPPGHTTLSLHTFEALDQFCVRLVILLPTRSHHQTSSTMGKPVAKPAGKDKKVKQQAVKMETKKKVCRGRPHDLPPPGCQQDHTSRHSRSPGSPPLAACRSSPSPSLTAIPMRMTPRTLSLPRS